MYRRFDVDTYRAESAQWHVEKFVNVAAATGPNSVDETIELDAKAGRAGRPGRHRRRASTGRLRRRGDRVHRPADGGAPLPRRPPHGRPRRGRPRRRRAARAAGPEPGVRADDASRPARSAAAQELSTFDDLTVVVEHTGWPRNDSDEERALWKEGIDALAGLGANVVCKLSGLAMPLGSMRADDLRPWLEYAIEAFGAERCMFASNFPVDSAAGSFDDLYSTFDAVTGGLDDASREALFAGTAERIYRL